MNMTITLSLENYQYRINIIEFILLNPCLSQFTFLHESDYTLNKGYGLYFE